MDTFKMGRKSYFSFAIIILAITLNSIYPPRAIANPVPIIQELGFQPIDAKPIPFTLQDLSSNKRTLEQYKGRWVFLLFWATWCGACLSELPSLESLHLEFEEAGLTILGISTDQSSPSEIASFIKNQNLTFPILHDASGTVASKYQASALPTIYLISPDFKLVGLMRGARNWDDNATIAKIKELIKYTQVTKDQLSAAQQGGGGSTPIHEDLAPPKIKIVSESRDFKPKKYQNIDIAIQWKGDSSKYIIKVPKIKTPDQVKIGKVSSSTQSTSGSSTLFYHFPISFTEEGKYHIGPIELSYQSRFGGKELFTRLNGIEIEVKKGTYPLSLLLGIGGITISLLILIGYTIFKRRKKTAKPSENIKSNEEFQEDYQSLRKFKLSGDRKSYTAKLIQLILEVIEEFKIDDPEKVELINFLEKVNYAGIEVADTTLRTYEKKLEKLISFKA